MTLQIAESKPTGDLNDAIRRLTDSDEIVPALREMRPLAEAARLADPGEAFNALVPIVLRHDNDPLAAYLAVHALAGVASEEVDALLARLVTSDHPGLREHAAWALSDRRPTAAAVPGLCALASNGGFPQMLAELALETWFHQVPELVWHTGNPVHERMHWLGERPRPLGPTNARAPGLRIAQVLMQGRVDAALSAPGAGDGGGLVTLQVGLTGELARHEAVDEVFLVTRRIDGEEGRFARQKDSVGPGGTVARLDFGEGGYLPISEMWAYRPELERKLREFFLTEGPFDALHLRFADVGTFVASRVGEELGIPTFFTLAPDPHAVIASAEASGILTRQRFDEADLNQHFLFRAWLVDRMLESADRLALLPRQGQGEQFDTLLGVDLTTQPERFVVIPEGVDYSLVESAAEHVASVAVGSDLPPGLSDLKESIAGLPEPRRGLPIILTVGRLNPVKGMSRVVEAWAGDPLLRAGFNLVVVGGNLSDPTPQEQDVLDSIRAVIGGEDWTDSGLVLMGNRSHRDVAQIMAATWRGMPGTLAPGGIYVSGSDKEEFGLAIVEAMAAGLVVVAPVVGGPSTYVDHGFTGYLADTRDIADLREGIRWASNARLSEVRADASRRLVSSDYSLRAMAEELVDLYSLEDAGRAAS